MMHWANTTAMAMYMNGARDGLDKKARDPKKLAALLQPAIQRYIGFLSARRLVPREERSLAYEADSDSWQVEETWNEHKLFRASEKTMKYFLDASSIYYPGPEVHVMPIYVQDPPLPSLHVMPADHVSEGQLDAQVLDVVQASLCALHEGQRTAAHKEAMETAYKKLRMLRANPPKPTTSDDQLWAGAAMAPSTQDSPHAE